MVVSAELTFRPPRAWDGLLTRGCRGCGHREQHERAHDLAHRQSCRLLISRNSSKPHLPYSRPRPDCLKPPKGAVGLKAPPLMAICPVRMRRATRLARSASEDQTPPLKPYAESFAIRIASSSSS